MNLDQLFADTSRKFAELVLSLPRIDRDVCLPSDSQEGLRPPLQKGRESASEDSEVQDGKR